MFATVLCFTAFIACFECSHIFNLDKDFSKLSEDKELAKHVDEVIRRLKMFQLPLHPRIRLFYQLLKLGMANYVRRTSDSLYNPSTYKRQVDNVEE